jgi:threonylcarbamoyladenosine tRNA methylthiotransferase MtaB
MRIAFATVGCRLNQFETDALRGKAEAAGFRVVPFAGEADVYVVNTCTITGEADADSRQLVRRAVRRNPAAVVAVTGCYAQASPEAVAAIPGVDLVLGNVEKAALFRHLREAKPLGSPRIRVADIAAQRRADGDEYGPGIESDRTRAFLKVQDGCSYACSFCIVPTVRGPNRSLPVEAILAEIRRLHAAGFPEVVLTGIHLGTYGRDLAPRGSLAALCRAIAELAEAPRIRLSSVDPHEVGDDLIRLLRDSPRFCRHLHLPLQSGDEAILRRMRRAHTAAQFRALVERLAATIAGLAVTADVIVGFPGEDEAAFRRTYDLVAALPVAGLHVFRFSPRAGTEAAGYPGQVPQSVKASRSRRLRGLAAEKARVFRQNCLGEILEAAVLHRDRPDGMREGISDNGLRVWFPGDAALKGRLVRVRIRALADGGVLGDPADIAD